MPTFYAIYAPINGFLPYLADGWRFDNDIAEPMPGHHGYWSVLLVRPAKARAGRGVRKGRAG